MKVRLHPFLPCMLCLMLAYADAGQAAAFFFSALAHEAGHVLCMALGNVPIRTMTITFGGAVLTGDFSRCPFGWEAMVHISGILVNALLCLILMVLHCGEAAAVNLVLCVYNLLPLPGHDGERFFSALAYACSNEEIFLRWLRFVSYLLSAVLTIFAAWLFWFCALHDTRGDTFLYGAMFFAMLQNLSALCRR